MAFYEKIETWLHGATKVAAVALVAGAGFFATADRAQSNTLQIFDPSVNPNFHRGNLACNGAAANACQGFLIASTPALEVLSSSRADLFAGVPSGDAQMATWAKDNLGIDEGIGVRTNVGGANPIPSSLSGFTSSALYLAFQVGTEPRTWFIKNTSGGQLTFLATNQCTGQGCDFEVSNVTEFGQVPLPAAAWLLLAGLGGMGLVARRRKAATA